VEGGFYELKPTNSTQVLCLKDFEVKNQQTLERLLEWAKQNKQQ
jgi:hypothetical protein